MINAHWSLYSLVIVISALAGFFFWYERQGGTPREVAVIATLAALAGLSRLPFAAIPSVQPTTFLVLIAGYVFGPGPGFMVGSLAAFASNFFLGQGPWTPWQMMAWGLAGVSGGILSRLQSGLSRWILVLLAFLWGFFFGWILNLWHWLTFVYPLTLQSFLATLLTSLWFDTMHAVGNALFMFFMGKELIKLLNRFKRRLTVSFLPVEKIEGR